MGSERTRKNSESLHCTEDKHQDADTTQGGWRASRSFSSCKYLSKSFIWRRLFYFNISSFFFLFRWQFRIAEALSTWNWIRNVTQSTDSTLIGDQQFISKTERTVATTQRKDQLPWVRPSAGSRAGKRKVAVVGASPANATWTPSLPGGQSLTDSTFRSALQPPARDRNLNAQLASRGSWRERSLHSSRRWFLLDHLCKVRHGKNVFTFDLGSCVFWSPKTSWLMILDQKWLGEGC